MKADEMRGKTADELKSQLVELKKQAFNLRFQAATGQLQSPAEMRQVRRSIARVKTILGEKTAPTRATGVGNNKKGVV
ncbi:MAG: 50S ribosomal protein L29 [Proteobacteria bacterium]|nr:50S ribosomal protein L29 [Pseudomonadota bacterium]